MHYTLKKISDTQTSLTVVVDANTLDEAKKAALKHLRRSVKVPGFRDKHVPEKVAEQHIDANVLASETAEEAINLTLNDIIDKEDLRVLDQPQIDVSKYVPSQEMEYVATIAVLPPVTLGDYKNLKTKQKNAEISQDEIDEVVERMLENLSEKKTVEREAKLGDNVVLDFVGKLDDVPFDGGTAEKYELVLGSKTFIPGFEEALVGHKDGDVFDVPLTFPKDYAAKHLAGKETVFSVKVHDIQEITRPELNDELAKKVGPFETVQDVKDDIVRELTMQKERANAERFRDDLVMELAGKSKLTVPDVLVDDQMRSIEQDATQNLMYRGMTPEEYVEATGYKDKDEWREKEFRPAAEQRVKAGLVLAELSKVEQIAPNKDELEARQAELVGQYPTMKEQLDTPEARRDLANRVLTEKTIERLVELNSQK